MLHELRWELCITSGHMLDTRAMKWVLFSILWLYSWGPKCPALVTLPQCCHCSHHSFNHSLLFLSDILDLISFNLLCPYNALSSGGEVHGKCYAFTKNTGKWEMMAEDKFISSRLQREHKRWFQFINKY